MSEFFLLWGAPRPLCAAWGGRYPYGREEELIGESDNVVYFRAYRTARQFRAQSAARAVNQVDPTEAHCLLLYRGPGNLFSDIPERTDRNGIRIWGPKRAVFPDTVPGTFAVHLDLHTHARARIRSARGRLYSQFDRRSTGAMPLEGEARSLI